MRRRAAVSGPRGVLRLSAFAPVVFVATGLGRGGAAATSRSASSLSADTARNAAAAQQQGTTAVMATGTFQLGGRR